MKKKVGKRGNSIGNYQKNSLNPTTPASRKKKKKANKPDLLDFRLFFFVYVDEIA